MAETYCGKTCGNCDCKELLNCPGCKLGPAQRFQCQCDLAKCCKEKCHETCDSCSMIQRCGLHQSREDMPARRLKRQQLEVERAESIAMRAPFLGRWLWMLFWLVVPSTLAGLGTQEIMATWSPALYWGATVLSLVCELCYGLILLRLSSQACYYKTAGICGLVLAGISVAALFLIKSALLQPMVMIASLIISLLRIYYELQGHAEIADGIQNELAMQWRTLWKWLLGAYLAVIGSFVLMLLSALLGAIALMGAAIVVLIANVVKWVLLYRTAKLFRSVVVE